MSKQNTSRSQFKILFGKRQMVLDINDYWKLYETGKISMMTFLNALASNRNAQSDEKVRATQTIEADPIPQALRKLKWKNENN